MLTGSGGNDALQGGEGLDCLLGDAGKEKLNGGARMDHMHPGSPETGIAKDSDKTRVLDPLLAFGALLLGRVSA